MSDAQKSATELEVKLPPPDNSARRTEAVWCASGETFRLAFDHAAIGRVVATPDGRFIRVNQSLCDITGFTADELLARTWRDMAHPEYLAINENMARRLLQGEIPSFQIESKANHKTGQLLWVHINVVLIRDDAGKPLGTIGDIADITERKRTEQALRESEQKFRLLADESPNMIFIQCAGKVVYVNHRCTELMGYSKEEFCADDFNFLSIIAPESVAVVKANDALHRQGRQCTPYEYSLVKKDGSFMHVILNSSLIRYGAGQALLGLVTDITERKQAEKKLAQEENLLRATLESTADGILVVSESGEVTHRNARFAELWRIPEDVVRRGDDDELLGFVLGQLTDPDGFLKRVRELYGTSEECLETLHFKDGRVFERYSRPLICDGSLAGRVWSFRDITERQQAREALEKLEREKRLILNSTSDLILYQDLEHRIVWANQACHESVGAAPEELVGRFCHAVWHERTEPCVDCPVARVFETGEPQESEIDSPDGRRWLIRGSPVLDDDGILCGAVEVTTDITERKRMEAELSRAKRLETAGQLAGQIAHDFNNLLGPLVAYPDLIRTKIGADGRLDDMLTDMETAATQIADINQQLLTLGRRGHYKTEPIDLGKLAERTLRSREISESIVVEAEWAGDLLPIRGGRAQLARVLSNLISNAVEAMGHYGTLSFKTANVYLDKPRPVSGCQRRGEYVRLDISDTGCGIPDDIRDQIFDPFFTTKKTDRRRGSGLGLAVAHSVIEDHEGFLDVHTRIGEGTTFSLYFPVDRTELPQAEESETLPHGNGERVMVVDDDSLQLRLAERTLTQLGYKVSTANSGEEAVKVLPNRPQDVLMIDMVMDGIDGVETLRRVKAINPDQKALIFSGYAPNNKIKEARELGATEFLPKPVHMSSLAQALHRTLHSVPEPPT